MDERCGKCENCLKVEKVKQHVLAIASHPTQHVDDDIVKIWNDSLKDWPCLAQEEEK